MSNLATYEKKNVVDIYFSDEKLQKPEITILKKISKDIEGKVMLDLGVGGGRTTLFFADLVKKYVGIDYAKRMIDACKKKFGNKKNVFWQVSDVRNLKEFKDNEFDFVLFSFNGLDYINEFERIKALKEIKRVLKNNGIFVFSTHNINNLKSLYSIKFSLNPLRLIWRIFNIFLLNFINGSYKKLIKKDCVIINDGAHGYGLKTYYSHPNYQLKQLRDLKFKNPIIYSLETGKEIEEKEISKIDDSWIYYLCINEKN